MIRQWAGGSGQAAGASRDARVCRSLCVVPTSYRLFPVA